MRFLVKRGADVKARSKLGRTDVLIAPAHDGNSQTVKTADRERRGRFYSGQGPVHATLGGGPGE